LWDGKVQTFGINPYLYAPISDSLNHLHSALLPESINHPEMKTIYFPLSQWIFFICYQLSGEAIWGIKLILILTEIATIIGLILLLVRLELPSKFVLFYALCPLPIFQFAIDAHLDGLGFPLFIFSLLLYLRRRMMLSLFLLGLSISIKPIGLILLPILFLCERTWKKRMKIFAIPILTVALQFIPYLIYSNPFESLFTFSKHWTFNGIIFEFLNLLFMDNQKSRLICAILLGLSLIIVYFSKKQLFDKIYFSVLLLLLLSPVVHPWYVGWLTILLPITRQWSGIIFTALVSLTSLTVLNYKLYGVWEQSPLILIIEYLPVIIFLLLELRTYKVEKRYS
jgi:hypothetical protein